MEKEKKEKLDNWIYETENLLLHSNGDFQKSELINLIEKISKKYE